MWRGRRRVDDLKWAIAREIPHLRRYARGLLKDADSADDLVQDCLERALRKRHLWRRHGSLRSWLFRIVFTQYLNGGAKRTRARATVSLDDKEIAHGHAAGMGSLTLVQPASQESHTEAVEVLAALSHLDRDQRAAILLVGVEGMAYDEAADALGIPIGTLRSRLWRGREALRTMSPGLGERSRPGSSPTPYLRRVK